MYEGSLKNPEKASQYAPAAVAMLFLFNLGLVVEFLHIPTSIQLLIHTDTPQHGALEHSYYQQKSSPQTCAPKATGSESLDGRLELA